VKEAEMVGKAQRLRESATELEQKIVETKTRDYFLRPVINGLDDVEKFLLPNARKSATHSIMWLEAAAFMLEQSEARLNFAKEMVSRYGTSLQLVG